MKYSRLFALISFLLPLFSKVVLSDSNNSSAAEKQRKISSPIEIHLSTVQVPRSFFVQQDSDMFIWPQLPNETKFLLTNESDSSVPLSTVVGMRLGTIGIGIPRQEFQVLINWNSADFWVYASANLEDDYDDDLRAGRKIKHNKAPVSEQNSKRWYNSSQSTTAFESICDDIDFDGGSWGQSVASGHVARDTITIGDTIIRNIEFGAITKMNWKFRNSEFRLPFEGKMGLSLVNVSGQEDWEGKARTILSPMSGLVKNADESILNIYQKPTTFEWDEPFFDGSMTIGAKGPQECSLLGNSKNTSWLNYVVKPGSYDGQPRIFAKSLRVGAGNESFDLNIRPREAIITEGLGIRLTPAETNRLGRHLAQFGARRIQPGWFQIPCGSRGKLPILRLEIGSHQSTHETSDSDNGIEIDFNEYIVNYRKKVCLLLVEGIRLHDPVIIGVGMFQGKCIFVNPVKQTIAFSTQN